MYNQTTHLWCNCWHNAESISTIRCHQTAIQSQRTMQHQFCTLTQHLSLLAYLSLWNILSTHIMSYYKNKTASVSLCYKSYCFKTANIKLSTVKHRSYLLNRLYHLLYLYIYIFIITPHLYHSAVCLKCKTKLQCLEFVDKICKQSCLHKWATTTTALRPLYRPTGIGQHIQLRTTTTTTTV